MARASGCPGNTRIRRGFNGEGYTCKPFAKCLQLSKCTCAQEPGYRAGKLLVCVVSSTELGQQLGRQITIAAVSRTSATSRAIPSPVQQGKIAIKISLQTLYLLPSETAMFSVTVLGRWRPGEGQAKSETIPCVLHGEGGRKPVFSGADGNLDPSSSYTSLQKISGAQVALRKASEQNTVSRTLGEVISTISGQRKCQ